MGDEIAHRITRVIRGVVFLKCRRIGKIRCYYSYSRTHLNESVIGLYFKLTMSKCRYNNSKTFFLDDLLTAVVVCT